MAVCFPVRQALSIFSLTYEEDRVKLLPLSQTSAISIASLRATRDTIYDLLVLKPDNRLVLFAQGLHELRIEAKSEPKKKDGIETGAGYDSQPTASVLDRKIVSLRDPVRSSVVLAFADDSESCTFLDFVPKDPLTLRALYCLSAPMSADAFFALHGTFLTLWSASGFRTSDGMEWNCFVTGLLKLFELEEFTPASSPRTHWEFLSKSPSANRFRDDPALGQLRNRPSLNVPIPLRSVRSAHLQLLGPVLYTLHMLGEDLRMQINHHQYLLRLAPLICCIALVIRPEWADYWKRICPEAWPTWPTSKSIFHCRYHLRPRS
jgi:anaphase-promoting complex subunit 1